MMQVPADNIDSNTPDTVHTTGVRLVKVTGRPELAVADSVSGLESSRRSGRSSNVIFCPPSDTPLRRTVLIGPPG